MAIEVTENWSARRLTFDYDIRRWKASRTLVVAYANDENEALAAASGGGPGVPPMATGMAHPLQPNIFCQSVEADRSQGLNVTLVKGSYAFSTEINIEISPLLKPPVITWQPSLQSGEIDYDPDGFPIVTAAGQPFDPPSTTDIGCRTLSVTRYQPFYDADQAGALENTINADDFQISGRAFNTAVRPGTCRCKCVAPVGDFTPLSPYVQVRWVFEIRGTYTLDVDGFSDAWDIRRPNKGTIGWRAKTSDEGTGAVSDYFYRKGLPPQKLTEPVYLDLTGKPLDDQIVVGNRGGAPIANPVSILTAPHVGYEQVSAPGVPGGKIFILHFRRFRAIPFSGLI